MATTLQTTFAGLSLRNPIIVSSSGLTDSAAKNQKLCEAGAGAIVLKSLFEEQIMMEVYHKKVCDIPVIASINCYKDDVWADFAKQIEEAGADALEINILALQTDVQYTYGSFEQRHIDILRHIKKTVKIPVIMKLGSNLTNPVALIDQLYANGAAAVVLFNRFYQPDINIDKMTQVAGDVFSNEADLSNSLRWTGIASAAVNKIDYAISGGIHSAEGIVKSILAGASAVEICSVLYKESSAVINEYNKFVADWMANKGMESIAQFKGKLNVGDVKGVNTFERTQFLKYFAQHE